MRDTIVVIGPAAAGKTAILNNLRDQLSSFYGVPFDPIPLTDSHTILERVRLDDNEGGYNHYHDWCPGNISGHSHEHDEPKLPFTVTGNEIAHGMMRDFFLQLTQIPRDRQLHFAEWSGGVNINLPSEPASRTDLSFTTIAAMLQRGIFQRDGLHRVLAVIHPNTPFEIRQSLNSQRSIPTGEDIRYGRASWLLSETALRIFGHDDFSDALEPLLQEAGIPHLIHVKNDGIESLDLALEGHLPDVLRTWSDPRVQAEGIQGLFYAIQSRL